MRLPHTAGSPSWRGDGITSAAALGCLDEDTVLAFIDGTLDASDRRSAESHLASCADCSDVVGTAAGGLPAALSDLGDAPSQAPSGFVRGAAVGRYVILNLVGRGGMGEVYAAYDPQLDRKVALKLLREQAPQAGRTSHARL